MILVITRWFPNKYEPLKCIFTKNILDAQARYTKYQYTLISPVPYFPKRNLPFASKRFKNFSRLDYKEKGNGYEIYRPKYFKLPDPLSKELEWHTYFRAVCRVIKRERLKFDLIHSHGIYPDGYTAVKIGEYFRIPVVIHLHDSYFKKIHKTYSQKIDKIMSYCERVIVVSEFQKRNIVELYNNYAGKICTIYNGVDINKFDIAYQGLEAFPTKDKNEVKIVFIGNLLDVKGVDILIHALNILEDNISISCDIYGDGKNKKKCQAMVNALSLANVVKFKGFINNDILPRYLKKYSFLVLPSRYETFGIVLIEAMACGIPVIATKVGAIPEIVASDEVGILVKPNSPEALAEGIKNATKKDWDREKIRDYATKFSIEKTAIEVGNVYDEILNERKRAL